jgi:hypothetical protein
MPLHRAIITTKKIAVIYQRQGPNSTAIWLEDWIDGSLNLMATTTLTRPKLFGQLDGGSVAQ